MQAQQKSLFVSSTIFPPSLSTISAHEEKGPVPRPSGAQIFLVKGDRLEDDAVKHPNFRYG
jgi:hypothetical protein